MKSDSQFLGNEAVVERLQAKLVRGRFPHAVIFSGPDGVGKRTCAVWIAQSLNCPNRNPLACRICPQCRKIINGTHPDVQTVGVSGDASQIKIEQVRHIRSMLSLAPLEGSAKVYIIDPAERMTASAANALLKALEEPPSGSYLFLITPNANELLITMRSRSQIYHFVPLRLEEIRLAGVDDELVVRWSQGSIGRALRSDAEGLRRDRDALLEFLEIALMAEGTELGGLLAASADLARAKDDYKEKIRILGVLLADLLYLKEGLERRLVNVDVEERLRKLERTVTIDRILNTADCLRFIERNLKHHLNRQMLTSSLALVMNPTTGEILNDKLSEYR